MTISIEAEVRASISLAVLGITAREEQIYRLLLRSPGMTVESLAAESSIPATELRDIAEDLQRKGLAISAPERKLFPSPPDIAIETLLLHRQSEMQQARLAIADLQREHSGAAGAAPVVEIIDAEPAAHVQPYAQCHQRASREVLCLMRPPLLASAPNQADQARNEARTRGVRYRNIVHPDVFAMPGWPERLHRDCEAGEELRLLPEFPFRMIVADRELGLLPLKIGEPEGPMLLLRQSAVLDALCELFDSLWMKAVPIHFRPDGSHVIGQATPFPAQLDPMISLLAAGVQDKVAAQKLGISERTLVRRLELLYQTLNARSRFQAGWLAALLSAKADQGR